MKFVLLHIAGLFLFGLITTPTHANGEGCPAFNAGMVDAAMLATEFNQEVPVDGIAIDYPSEPYILCRFNNEDWGHFSVFVGYYEDEERSDYEAHIYGRSPIHRDTLLRTHVFGLSNAQLRACRAQVLQSFVWNKYCLPLME